MDFTERKRRHLERREAFQRFRTLANEVSDLSKQVLACHEHDRELSERLEGVRTEMHAVLIRYEELVGTDDDDEWGK